MNKINFKEYDNTKLFIVYDDHSTKLIDRSNVKELSEEEVNNCVFRPALKDNVFDYKFIERFKDWLKEYAEDNNFEHDLDKLDLNNNKFKKVEDSLKEYVDSLEELNDVYYLDDNTEIIINEDDLK